MSIYTVQLDRPHATRPTVEWDVTIWDLVDGGAISPAVERHRLAVPNLDSWIPDTLRLVLYELSAYLPAHDHGDAMVRIGARMAPRRGRTPKIPKPERFDDAVSLSVEARGWRAEVETWRNQTAVKQGEYPTQPGFFSEPMQALLLELAAASPISLASIAPEFSAPGILRDMKPSRLNVLRGREAPYDEAAKQWRDDIADVIERTRRILDSLRKDLQ